MSSFIKKILSVTNKALYNPYFGFVRGHTHLSQEDWQHLYECVGINDDDMILKFEHRFAALVGKGDAVSYATGRMGFFHLMQMLEIGKDDEIILQGATCSVMVNAILRTGAKPVFSDIDEESFGSSAVSIACCITPHTRMIVAQHSFGIPCDIEAISALAKQKGIFLLEDCALTLGSQVNGLTVGNFGDAALFSTDHGKPLNTLTGGLIYSLDKKLINHLRFEQAKFENLSVVRQKALWRRLKLEAIYCVPNRYGRMMLIDMVAAIAKRLNILRKDFLDDDFGVATESGYPYPARLPAFLAMLGLFEIDRWPMVRDKRIALLNSLLGTIKKSQSATCLPACYDDHRIKIIPLRIAWWQTDGNKIRNRMSYFMNTDWTFFMNPIIATKEKLSLFGYQDGSCPVSEKIGPLMINIPCNIPLGSEELLIEKIAGSLN